MRRRRSAENELITGKQIRAARKLLGWSRTNLAKRAKIITPYTIKKSELSGLPPTEAQERSLRRTLEAVWSLPMGPGEG
jgi:ribosome-binding protein aMBF1 (putative translation factor)